jgi:WD40 repeat protein
MLKVWDVQTRPNPLVLKGAATSSVASLAFSPDGKRLASGSDGQPGSGTGAVTVWDTQTGQETLALKGHNGPVISVVFSPDGKRLASGNWDSKRGGEVKLWDAQTGQQLLSLQGGGYTVDFSPDGKRLASAGYHLERPGEVKVWDAQTGQQLLSLKGAHPHGDYSVAFSPDGKRLASGAGWPGGGLPGAVSVWDAQTGKRVLSLHGRGLPPQPDDPRDAQTGERLSLNGHRGSVLSVAFSPDGKRLASAALDGMVKVWDAQTGQELLTCNGHIHAVRRVIFSSDGKRLVSTGSGGLKVWDAHIGQELLTLKGVNVPVALSPDGHWLATAREDSTVTIWDATPQPEESQAKDKAL